MSFTVLTTAQPGTAVRAAFVARSRRYATACRQGLARLLMPAAHL